MKAIFLILIIFCSTNLFADEPKITLAYQNSHNFYATVAGRVVGRTATQFLVTVENAGLKYTTITDESGNFGIIFRHLAVKFNVSAKSLANANEDRIVLEGTLTPHDE